jgi:hypothetical protein
MASNDKYLGPDKRKEPRRQTSDRRTQVRWEPDKGDRRQSFGRRKDDRTWKLPKK